MRHINATNNVTYSDVLRECHHFPQQQTNSTGGHEEEYLSDDVTESDQGVSLDESESPNTIEALRGSVGEFGIALFAPLLDIKPLCIKHTPTKQSCSSLTAVTDAESDYSCYQTEDEEDDSRNEAVQLVPEPLHLLQACPRILTSAQMQTLKGHLPIGVADNLWERCFAIGLHGDSFISLLQKCAGYKHTIICIRTTTGDILGGFASEEWRVQKRHVGSAYYGTGQSFVYTNSSACTTSNTESGDTDDLAVYKWTGKNDYCQICDNEKRHLCMGGVGDFGWIVSDDFSVGQTGWCATFGNPPLCVPQSFEIEDFEIYGLAAPVYGFGSPFSNVSSPLSL